MADDNFPLSRRCKTIRSDVHIESDIILRLSRALECVVAEADTLLLLDACIFKADKKCSAASLNTFKEKFYN